MEQVFDGAPDHRAASDGRSTSTSTSTSPSSTSTSRRESASGPAPAATANLTIASFNVAGFERSEKAPAFWSKHDSEEVLYGCLSDADAACLQEVPHAQRFEDSWWASPMVASHCLCSCVLLRHSVFADPQPLLPPIRGVVGAKAVHRLTGISVCFFSLHLAPFAEGARERVRAMADLLAWIGNTGQPLPTIFAGDCNMRKAEVTARMGGARKKKKRKGGGGGVWGSERWEGK